MGCLVPLPWLPLSRTQLAGLSRFVIWFGGGGGSQKLPACVYAVLSGDLAYVVLKFQRLVAEVARLGENYPWAVGQSTLCAPPPSANSPGGTGFTAGLCAGCGGTAAERMGWGKETRSGGWQEIRKPVDDGQAVGTGNPGAGAV